MTFFKATSRSTAICGFLFQTYSRCSRSALRAPTTLRGLLLLAISLYSFAATAGTITLSSDTDTATAGYYQLNWQSSTPAKGYALYESMYEDFSHTSLIYRGNDLGAVISGKPDAVYYYRVSLQQQPEINSNTIRVIVRHHPLKTAFSFFTIGAIVFIATLLLVLLGHRQRSSRP